VDEAKLRQKTNKKVRRYPQNFDMKMMECALAAGFVAKKVGGYLYGDNA
jgi:hypothetical protein